MQLTCVSGSAGSWLKTRKPKTPAAGRIPWRAHFDAPPLTLYGFIAIASEGFGLLRPSAKLITVPRSGAVGRYYFRYREPIAINYGPTSGMTMQTTSASTIGKL